MEFLSFRVLTDHLLAATQHTHLFTQAFCQRVVPDSVFRAFYCYQSCVFAQYIHPVVKQPSHPKNKREDDLQKYIKIFFPFTAQGKRLHALNPIVSTFKLESRIMPPRVWNHPSPCNYFQVVLTWFEKYLINRITFTH